MKKLILLTVFVASSAIINYSAAQVRFNVNVGFGLPGWIAAGNTVAEYYYIPEIDAYYDVPQREFIYLNNGAWVFSAGLPGMYAGFDLYNCRKFPVYESRPYLNGNYYRDRYAGYRGNYNYGYRQPMVVYNNSRFNGRYGYDRDDHRDRDDYYRNDRRFDERRYEDHDHDRGGWGNRRGH
ncbi:hypothetical protein GALL_48230 [mine drainage metagenome]|uniref:Uncharacterized protein n=1 Tax=mine drainage metagenome TaxID=410659 RepID=A0A1J5TQT6_9ZZZZ